MQRRSLFDIRQPEFVARRSSLVIVAALAAFAANAAPVYLKNGATGACDGSSWANAYTNAAVAIKAAEAGDGLLYVARGVYVFTNTVSITSPLAIYGGFAGQSMDETPATRDTAANQTVFSGDTGGDDYWIHYVPNESTFGITSTALTGSKVIGPNGVNLPPAFTGEYDGYRSALVGSNIAKALSIGSGAVCVLNGLTFACFSSTSSGGTQCVTIASAGTVVEDCTFIANIGQQGALYSNAATAASDPPTARNCRFLFNWGQGNNQPGGGVYYSCSGSVMTISNCQFTCVSRTVQSRGNCLHVQNGGIRVRGCTFARCLMAPGSNQNKNYGGPGNIFSSESKSFSAFYDCVVTNCYTASGNDVCIPTLSTGSASVKLERCHFANNRQIVKPIEGKCYPMFGNVWSTDPRYFSFEACTFASNVVAATAVSATSGSYVLALIGNYNVRCDARLLNCSFDGNRCEAVAAANVTPVFCRGVATASYSAGDNIACLANCAFLGPADGTYDIVQYGATHQNPLNLVNCVFTAPGEAQPDPVYADVPALVNLRHCSVQNRLVESGGLTYAGLQGDKIPLVRAAAAGPRYALAAAAATPGIRETCDVATNSVTETAISSWNFRLPDSETWQSLTTSATVSGDFSAKLVGDALGAARPSGTFTRGPVQGLVEPAETGATLVLRRDPFGAGAFSGEAVQAVAAGAAPTPVTVSANDPASYAFAGWYDANGDLFSSSATLSIPSLAAGTTVLTARIQAKVPVTLTFSLDGHGTFDSTGADTATVEADAYSAFPAVPSFTIDDGWFFDGFTLPDTVPDANATYTARIVTKDVRVIRVVPAAEAPATQDGLTWETAYADVATAYADAGTYRGEVWLKEGLYLLRATITMLPNVAVRGGFVGTETDAFEADPDAHPSILTGDVANNDCWYANNNSSLSTYRLWTGTTFNPPAPTDAQWCYAPKGNNIEDTVNAFACTSGTATNCLFDGVTFTAFNREAVRATSGATDGLRFSRCRFLGCFTSCDNGRGGAVGVSSCELSFTNCTFIGNWRCLNLEGASVASVADCVFSNTASGQYGGAIYTIDSSSTEIRRCVFGRNGCNSRIYSTGSALSFYNSSTSARHVIEDCLFADNWAQDQCHGCVTLNKGSATLARCRFKGNVMVHSDSPLENAYSACLTGLGGTLLARDCHFGGNRARDYSGNDPIATVAAVYKGNVVLANCTVEGSETAGNHADACATFVVDGSGTLALVNTLVDGSSFSGSAASEFLCTTSDGAIAIVNAIVRNEGAGYAPFAFANASFQPTVASSVISGYDPADMPDTGANGYLYDVVSATAAVGPLREGADGALARAVSGPAYAKLGRPVWLVGSTPYIHDAASNAAKPWRSLLSRSSHAASVTGLTLETPPLPDAFGAARKSRYCAPGPLNAAPMQTVIKVK